MLHLARATARRENAEALLDTCGLEGEIWPAVDGTALSAADVTAVYQPGLFRPSYPFKLRPGEIGCFLSHRQIWSEIVRRNLDAALILEDDVALSQPTFASARDLALQHVGTLGYIKMRATPPKGRVRIVQQRDGATLVTGDNPGLGATAQCVSRNGALQLLKHSKTFDRPVDTFIQSHWFTGLAPSTVYPSGVEHIDVELAGSTIQGKDEGILELMSRELRRARYRYAVKKLSSR
ncbi:glycosyltransferase family 25 protein [Roseovarius dicentrarchi]|uniref:glycosyltransferase family 25 protein n=1 Tax=Roseovarius dicentrarchi TaxID=2250573 RepID=UPI001EF050AD|nr:glycosyltransferase family 25 protein [Roseovarius dicentrarchi]